MSIDKALYEAPQGLAQIDGPEIEIEILPEMDMEEDILEISTEDFSENLAETIPDSVLATLGSELVEGLSSIPRGIGLKIIAG